MKRSVAYTAGAEDAKKVRYEEGGAAMRLRLSPNDEYVYAGDQFHLEVHLDNKHDKKDAMLPGSVPLQVKMLDASGADLKHEGSGSTSGALEILGNPQIRSGHSAQLALRVRKDVCELYQNQWFIIVVGLQGHSDIARVQSTPIKFVKYKLFVEMSGTEEGGLWYKDQGGRDKAITLKLEVRHKDQDGKEKLWVPPDSIPLECKLMYKNGTEVSNKNLLKISPECSKAISPEDGRGDIKFRIEDVSKNHQKMLFCLHVSPDYKMKNGAFTNIAPVTSHPVNVKSKVSKRPKQIGAKMDHAVGVGGAVSADNSVHKPPFLNPSSSGNNYMGSNQMQHSSIRARGDTQSLYSVIQWAGTVVKAVEAVEWSFYGYELGVNGEIDKSKPMFRCPACKVVKNSRGDRKHRADCCIAKVMVDYTDTVYHSLETLLEGLGGDDGSH